MCEDGTQGTLLDNYCVDAFKVVEFSLTKYVEIKHALMTAGLQITWRINHNGIRKEARKLGFFNSAKTVSVRYLNSFGRQLQRIE